MDFNLDISLDDVMKEIEKDKGKTQYLKFAEGKTIVRLLPPPKGHKVPWSMCFRHFTKMPTGQWESLNCPTTEKQPCAICKEVSDLYNSKDPENIDVAKKLKRQKKYYYNVYLHESPHPDFKDKTGQVFVMQVGPKIHERIEADLKNKEIGLSLFNPIKGFDFIIEMTKNKGGMPNYDLSATGRKLYSIVENQEALDKLMDGLTDLSQFTKMVSFGETKAYLDKFLLEDFNEQSGDDEFDGDTEAMFQDFKPEMDKTKQTKVETKEKTKPETVETKEETVKPEKLDDNEQQVQDSISDYLNDLNS